MKSHRPVTVVTGGSRGIGAAISLQLAQAGHDLVISYRSDTSAAEDMQSKVEALGVRCLIVQANVCLDEHVERLFAAVHDDFGYVTGLVNNAGTTAHIGPLADTPTHVIREVIDANLTGTILCARQAVTRMARSRGGRGGNIVNISSVAATLGSPGEYVHYAAAKAGVDAFTMGLAKEVASEGIRVNAVAPGTVRTDIHSAAGDPGRPDRVARRIPLGRAGEPNDIAPTVAYLFSPAAAYITGTTIRVAGGL